MSEIDSSSSALSAIRLRRHSLNPEAELMAAENWAKANQNKHILTAVQIARKEDNHLR